VSSRRDGPRLRRPEDQSTRKTKNIFAHRPRNILQRCKRNDEKRGRFEREGRCSKCVAGKETRVVVDTPGWVF